MQFDIDLAIQIGNHLQNQDLVKATIGPEDIPHRNDDEEQWKIGERLEAQLLLMQDAGWLDNVEIFNAAGEWEARLTYQGYLWLDASKDEGIMERIKLAIQNKRLHVGNTVIAEVIKGIVSSAT